MSTLLLTRPGRDAITAGSSRPGQAQSHARGRGLRAAPAQPRLRARRHRHDPSAWCSCQAARDERRSRAVCRAAVRDPGLLNVPGPPKRPDGRFSATWRRLQQTFPILKYEQLLKRVAGTFVLVAFARLGHFMPVEGIDPFAGQYTPGEGPRCSARPQHQTPELRDQTPPRRPSCRAWSCALQSDGRCSMAHRIRHASALTLCMVPSRTQ